MQLTQRRQDGVLVATLTGRVDHANAEEFRLALAPVLDACTGTARGAVLDCAGLEYISSAGLRVLMLAARRVKEQDGVLVVAALGPVLSEIFEITRFNLVLRVLDRVDAAVAELATARAA